VQPGARVVGNGHVLAVFGTLRAVGIAGNPVVFRDVRLRGRGSYTLPSTVETFAIEIQHADIDGGDLQGGEETSYGSISLRDSIVSNLADTIYLWYPRADCHIEHNTFLNCGKISCGLMWADVYVRDNLFWRSEFSSPVFDAVAVNWTAVGHTMHVNGNSFSNPGMPTVALDPWNSSGAMDASGNWWGVPSTDTGTIASMVFDKSDDLTVPGYIDTTGALGVSSQAAASAGLPLGVTATAGPSSAGLPIGAPAPRSPGASPRRAAPCRCATVSSSSVRATARRGRRSPTASVALTARSHSRSLRRDTTATASRCARCPESTQLP